MIKLFTGLISTVLGLLSFQLAAWTPSSFNSAPLQFGCAAGAVAVGIWTYRTSNTPYAGRVLAMGAAFIGIAAGSILLGSAGLLWLLWPK
ncbi:MAG: hypothetical protein JWN15_1075 [Firmicutes bacterium]|nr:hypothetical protein [Bacillota bacterium]